MDNVGTVKAPAADSGLEVPFPEASHSRWRRRFTWGSLLVTLIAAAVVLPPLINVGRYQRQVTTLVARSLGRPVQLSSVELRLLPRPGFILNNLSVAEDPDFGTEPVLTARTVIASIRILSLWKGNLAIDSVSVDDASLNLVQSSQGRWNLESLMLGARPTLTQNSEGTSSTAPGKSASFPYLEATNSRVQLKRGFNKSPYAIMNTDLSLWQADAGQWRVRLRGQPVRTDIEMSWADTGEVRMEATLRTAAQLRDMPINLQLEWREAHLGQLSRLILGSDAGWRGEVTADIDVQGTADSAQTKARFQATGVRREEFAPETPLDLDANCSFEYRHSQNAIHALSCDTALGTGQLHLKAELPGSMPGSAYPGSVSAVGGSVASAPAATPTAMLEVQQVPLQAALDLIHTVRAGFAPGISAQGFANGSLIYKPLPPLIPNTLVKSTRAAKLNAAARKTAVSSEESADSLQGAITVSGATLKGGELKEVLILPTMSWVPTSGQAGPQTEAKANPEAGLETKFTMNFTPPASAIKAPATTLSKPDSHGAGSQVSSSTDSPAPQAIVSAANASPVSTAPPSQELTIRLAIAQSSFNIAVNGTVATPRLRSLAYAFGLPHSEGLDSFAGGTSDLDLTAKGPWLMSYEQATYEPSTNEQSKVDVSNSPNSKPASRTSATESLLVDQIPTNIQAAGAIQMHHAQWKPSYLASPADLQQAVVTINGNRLSFTSEFTYGTAPAMIKGTAIVQGSPACEGANCEPQIQIHFAAIDAATVQAALTGTSAQKSVLSPIMDRVRDRVRSKLHSPDKPAWPPMTLNVDADSLVLGQTTLRKPLATVRVNKDGDLQLERWQAGVLGGEATGTGSCQWSNSNPGDGKPEYEFEGSFTNISPSAAGNLAAAHWSGFGFGSGINGKGELKLSGLDWKELASSANGEIQFVWAQGSVITASPQPVLFENLRFENWTGTLAIRGGKAELGKNTMISGKRNTSLAGGIPLGGAARFTIAQQLASAAPPSPQPASATAPNHPNSH